MLITLVACLCFRKFPKRFRTGKSIWVNFLNGLCDTNINVYFIILFAFVIWSYWGNFICFQISHSPSHFLLSPDPVLKSETCFVIAWCAVMETALIILTLLLWPPVQALILFQQRCKFDP